MSTASSDRSSRDSAAENPKLYDGGAEAFLQADTAADRISIVPGGGPTSKPEDVTPRDRVRILWGQDMLRDVVDGRYRSVICGVNDQDNAHGIISQLVSLIPTSQWRVASVTSYAHMFHESASIHAAEDQEPYVLKYDLDSVLILALLRPKGRDHFTLQDLSRGFATACKMLQGRRDRMPAASVSFLGARSNRLVDESGNEPSFETVLRTMHSAGYRGDVYPSPAMWSMGQTGVFATYPFPVSLDTMREGGH